MYIKLLLVFLFFISSQIFVCADETIKAQNNAYIHNNRGLMYLSENYYFGAIKEFQMAIDLNPNSQASSAYYINLADTYEKIGYYGIARPYYEKAVSLNPLCFNYYLKMTKNYKTLGIVDEKLAEFEAKKDSPLNDVIIGLLYIQKGQVPTGITVLDDFCDKEPNLLITVGVRNYLNQIVKEKL
ncbi:MAG: tetratricopeptide repeat protein [Candidatus Gastranaerophilales bacterium]|nr:tetratricopeptide repeat protein [Candidatus Gastranaerophilales bacterium]